MPGDDVIREMELGVEVVNHALRGIPEERVRSHWCSGSGNRPHTQDIPLRKIAPTMLKLKAQAYGFEAANPRHEHEIQVWEDIRLPEGKIIMPGLISQSTNVVEHPELIAWRIKNFARLVGKENVIAGSGLRLFSGLGHAARTPVDPVGQIAVAGGRRGARKHGPVVQPGSVDRQLDADHALQRAVLLRAVDVERFGYVVPAEAMR